MLDVRFVGCQCAQYLCAGFPGAGWSHFESHCGVCVRARTSLSRISLGVSLQYVRMRDTGRRDISIHDIRVQNLRLRDVPCAGYPSARYPCAGSSEAECHCARCTCTGCRWKRYLCAGFPCAMSMGGMSGCGILPHEMSF